MEDLITLKNKIYLGKVPVEDISDKSKPSNIIFTKISKKSNSQFLDISKIISAKTERRHALAALSWERKVSIIEQMRRLLPQKMWREKITDEKILLK